MVFHCCYFIRYRDGSLMCGSGARALTLLCEEKACFPWFLGPGVMVNTESYSELGHQGTPGNSNYFSLVCFLSLHVDCNHCEGRNHFCSKSI